MSNTGIVFYNYGTSCCARLVVSLRSLRRHYSGPITILSEGDESQKLCKLIADAYGIGIKQVDFGVPAGNNKVLLSKTKLHTASPYDVTLFLDSDTLIMGTVDELFPDIEANDFIVPQFSTWVSNGRTIGRRVRLWTKYCPHLVPAALSLGPAVNSGVFGFTKSSELVRDWYDVAVKGREFYICDETSLQLILPQYKHKIVDQKWNNSCRYSRVTPETKIIHFHDRKHCRKGNPSPFSGQLWVDEFNQVRDQNIANIRDWEPAGDHMLARYESWLKDAHAQSASV